MTDDAVLDETRQPARRKLLQVLGPGLITGASDDDPSGIALFAGGLALVALASLGLSNRFCRL